MAQLKQTIRVLMADDHEIFRDGVRKLLESEDDIKIVGEASNGNECVHMLAKLKPDILLLDLRMPGKDGLAVLEETNPDSLTTRIIVLTAAEDERDAVRAMRLGAPRHCFEAVRQRFAGEKHPPGSRRRNLDGQSHHGRGDESFRPEFRRWATAGKTAAQRS